MTAKDIDKELMQRPMNTIFMQSSFEDWQSGWIVYKGKRTGSAIKHALSKKRRNKPDEEHTASMISHYEFNPNQVNVHFNLETGKLIPS